MNRVSSSELVIADTFLIEYYMTIKSNALETMKQHGKFVCNIKFKKEV